MSPCLGLVLIVLAISLVIGAIDVCVVIVGAHSDQNRAEAIERMKHGK